MDDFDTIFQVASDPAVKIAEREKVKPGKPPATYYVYAITSNQ